MATRTIVATKNPNGAVNIFTSGSMLFPVDSDSGPVTGMPIASASMYMSAVRLYRGGQYFQVKNESNTGDVFATTSVLPIASEYTAITLPLSIAEDALPTDELSTICLTLQNTDASASETVYMETGCRLILTITYASRCGTPGNVRLSASQSSGSVVLQWSAAADGDGNAVRYYEVERQESANGGSTWSPMVSMGTTTNLYKVVSPPQTVGNMYRFLVRAVGTAGDDFASYWVQSGTLTKILPVLAPYTDPVITAGVTKVKAAHITELQTNINTVRTAYNWSAYTFTPITAHYTGLDGWNAHITELRKAIDDVSTSHETWLALGDNCPRADVLEQLRRVVEAVAND